MHPDWVRSLRDQCIEARVPFFFFSNSGGRGHQKNTYMAWTCQIERVRSYDLSWELDRYSITLDDGMEVEPCVYFDVAARCCKIYDSRSDTCRNLSCLAHKRRHPSIPEDDANFILLENWAKQSRKRQKQLLARRFNHILAWKGVGRHGTRKGFCK